MIWSVLGVERQALAHARAGIKSNSRTLHTGTAFRMSGDAGGYFDLSMQDFWRSCQGTKASIPGRTRPALSFRTHRICSYFSRHRRRRFAER